MAASYMINAGVKPKPWSSNGPIHGIFVLLFGITQISNIPAQKLK